MIYLCRASAVVCLASFALAGPQAIQPVDPFGEKLNRNINILMHNIARMHTIAPELFVEPKCIEELSLTDSQVDKLRALSNGRGKAQKIIEEFAGPEGLAGLSEKRVRDLQVVLQRKGNEFRTKQAETIKGIIGAKKFQRLQQIYVQSLMLTRRAPDLNRRELLIDPTRKQITAAVRQIRKSLSNIRRTEAYREYDRRLTVAREVIGAKSFVELFGEDVLGWKENPANIKSAFPTLNLANTGPRYLAFRLLFLPSVQKDLQLTNKQVASLNELWRDCQQRITAAKNLSFGTVAEFQASQKRAQDTQVEMEEKLSGGTAKILSDEQLVRLREVYLAAILTLHGKPGFSISMPLELGVKLPGAEKLEIALAKPSLQDEKRMQEEYEAAVSAFASVLGDEMTDKLIGEPFIVNSKKLTRQKPIHDADRVRFLLQSPRRSPSS